MKDHKSYYEQFYANTLNKLEKIDKFLKHTTHQD